MARHPRRRLRGGPIGNGALRATLAALLLAGLAFALKRPLPGGKTLGRLLRGGSVFVGVNFALVYAAAPKLPTSWAALLYATLPVQASLIGPALGREAFDRRVLLGATLGLAGLAISLRSTPANAGWWPTVLVLGAATASAVGAAMLRRDAADAIWSNALVNTGGALLLWPTSLALERGSPLPDSLGAWLGFGYMVVAGSLVGFLLYIRLLRQWTSARAAYVSLAASTGAVLVGALLGEPITLPLVAGGALVVAGGAVALRRPDRLASLRRGERLGPGPRALKLRRSWPWPRRGGARRRA